MPIAKVEGFRLSPPQRRLWRVADGHLRHWPACVCLVHADGPLDDPHARRRLRLAVSAIVQDREILRTRFQALPGMSFPLQMRGEADVDWRLADLSDLPAHHRARVAQAWFDAWARTADDRAERSAFAVACVRFAADRWIIGFRASPLSTDRHGLEGAVGEIVRAYGGRTSTIAGIQYADAAEILNQFEEERPPDAATAG